MIHTTLKKHFGFTRFRAGQEEVVNLIGNGDSVAAIFPTGSGKSLCYQLPALLLPGLTLVVSPLLSLMKDQIDFLAEKGLPAAKLDSTLDKDETRRVLADAKSGRLKILMVSVERFRNELFRNHLKNMRISLLVVDEAHCISEWGHNFRPDYLKIPAYRSEYAIPQVLLLTATATPSVSKDMCAKFTIDESHVINTGFFRENLHFNIIKTAPAEKNKHLSELLKVSPEGPAIVYVTLQKTAETVARQLNQMNFQAEAYHAGLKNEDREKIQNRFMNGGTPVVVATIAFGMGIDKADIRKVIHYDLPKSLENYSQETGRAGRDGQTSSCHVMGSRDDIPVLENFIFGDTPHKSGIKTLLNEIQNNPEIAWEVRLNTLSGLTDIRILPLKTLLVYLEMKNIIRPRHIYFEDYAFKFKDSASSIINRFQGERQHFVETIFAHTKTARVWSHPEIDRIIGTKGVPRKRITSALSYFDEQGWIELNVKGAVDVYEILNKQFDAETLADDLFKLFTEKEKNEIRRIHTMIDIFESPTCLSMNLSEYFGTPINNACGHCSVCCGGKSELYPEAPDTFMQNSDFEKITSDFLNTAGNMINETTITRFLCGITSPSLTRIKAKKISGFGLFESCRFNEVRRWVKQGLANTPKINL